VPDSSKLVETAMLLRAAEPEIWQRFVLAAREYSAAVNVEMVRCQPELLQRAQGMAIQANEIATILNDAPKIYEHMQNLMLGKRHGGKENQTGFRA
jgi:hypothetical protein